MTYANWHKQKHGYLPPKVADVTLWKPVYADLVGAYIIKANDGIVLGIMCLTMANPTNLWFEIVELQIMEVKCVCTGKETIEVVFDSSSARIAKLFKNHGRVASYVWWVLSTISMCKLFFEDSCDSFSLKCTQTMIKNPQVNAIFERMYTTCSTMSRTSDLDM